MGNIEVFYPSGRKLRDWESAYVNGTVPDRWPYGLNRMNPAPGYSIDAVEAQPLSSIGLGLATIGRLRSAASGQRNSVAIAWDEDLALRLAVERARVAKYAGVIWCTDRIYRGQGTFKDAILRRILPSFDGLWALSRAQIGVLGDWLGYNAPPIEFLRFGIDHEFFRPTPYPEEPVVLSIGRDRDRDADTLFETFEEIKRLRPETRMFVQTTSERSAPAGVEVLPMLSHARLRDYYQRASVILVATRPNLHVSGMTVALEGMASARPVVISRTPGMDDYVEDGVSGLLYSPGDSQGMAHGVADLLAGPDAAQEMGRAGRESVERRHTTERMAESLRTIVLGGTKGNT
jgi:glycosyltransferase involved in cell wall biosynthesis